MFPSVMSSKKRTRSCSEEPGSVDAKKRKTTASLFGWIKGKLSGTTDDENSNPEERGETGKEAPNQQHSAPPTDSTPVENDSTPDTSGSTSANNYSAPSNSSSSEATNRNKDEVLSDLDSDDDGFKVMFKECLTYEI